jgi:ubiquinone/menaquinone biosynthesis C-methylase UbiE
MTPSTDGSSLNYLGILFVYTLLVSASGLCPSLLPTVTNRGAARETGWRHPDRRFAASRRDANTNNKISVFVTGSDVDSSPATITRAPPRTGLAQGILDWALTSPLWKHVLVPQARANIVRTAEANQIPWTTAKAWIQNQMMSFSDVHCSDGDGTTADDRGVESGVVVPDYYKQAFHAYETGNLSWDAAYEVEIASCAVGARNFPQYGSEGEDAFRGAFHSALIEAGARVPTSKEDAQPILIADFGCGTGMSTRRLAKNHPQADAVVGIDLSPYFIAVGKRLLELSPASFHDGGPWVSTIEPDSRIQYMVGDISAALTQQVPQLKEGSVDVVNVQFVLHELPPHAARDVVDEACRLLQPQGQLWICEMDFESPAYASQRSNPLLFSLIRSTEPYLDVYAESISSLFAYIQQKFEHVKVVPATGRHFALVATGAFQEGDREMKKGTFEDERFDQDGNYRVEDTHLKLWESSQIDG